MVSGSPEGGALMHYHSALLAHLSSETAYLTHSSRRKRDSSPCPATASQWETASHPVRATNYPELLLFSSELL